MRLLLLLTSDLQTVLQSDTMLSLSLCFPLNANFCWSEEGSCLALDPSSDLTDCLGIFNVKRDVHGDV